MCTCVINVQFLLIFISTDVPLWLKQLMSVCLLKAPAVPDHHYLVFVSLETLLTLLEWQLMPCPLPASNSGRSTIDSGSPKFNFFSKPVLDHILLNVKFEKVCTCTFVGVSLLHSFSRITYSLCLSFFGIALLQAALNFIPKQLS